MRHPSTTSDYWSELHTSSDVKLHLVQNCVRCVSLNIDYSTGKPGQGESGKVLKKLQSDRRVDKGSKYSPVFGRYAFLGKGGEGKVMAVGDEVTITQRNAERTTFGESILCCDAVQTNVMQTGLVFLAMASRQHLSREDYIVFPPADSL